MNVALRLLGCSWPPCLEQGCSWVSYLVVLAFHKENYLGSAYSLASVPLSLFNLK